MLLLLFFQGIPKRWQGLRTSTGQAELFREQVWNPWLPRCKERSLIFKSKPLTFSGVDYFWAHSISALSLLTKKLITYLTSLLRFCDNSQRKLVNWYVKRMKMACSQMFHVHLSHFSRVALLSPQLTTQLPVSCPESPSQNYRKTISGVSHSKPFWSVV